MKARNNKMKKIIVFLSGFMIMLAGYGQSKDADRIIRDITEKTQSYESVEFRFTFTYQDAVSGEDVSEKGMLIISGDKYILEIEGQRVICDGETIWTFLEDAWEVQINAVEDDDESITPSKLLTTYNEDYKARLDKEYNRDGINYQRIELKPQEGKKWVMLEVVVNADEEQISEITIHDKNGGKIHYQIDEFNANIDVDDDDFIFRPEEHPDIEVVDMR